jgi:hypothetical protein
VGLQELQRWQRDQELAQQRGGLQLAPASGADVAAAAGADHHPSPDCASPALEQLLQQTIHHNHAATQRRLQQARPAPGNEATADASPEATVGLGPTHLGWAAGGQRLLLACCFCCRF